MEEEYLILQCPACERSVKVKSSAAGVRMGCPYCKEPLEVADTDPEQVPPDDAEDLQERPPMAFRRIQDTESLLARADSGSEGAQRGERRKHRKRQGVALDWDEKGDREKGERDGKGSGNEDSSEFLEMDPDTPGGVRLKRVRRKKLLTKQDKFFRGITAAVVVAAVVIAGVIIYSAVVKIPTVIATGFEVSDDVKKAMAEALSAPEPISDQLTQADERLAAATLGAFLNAKSVEERLLYVRNPEEMRPLMTKWYAENPEEAEKEWPDAEILRREKRLDKGRYFIVLGVDFVGIGLRVLGLEQRAKNDLKLDWVTTVGYQPMPLAKFKATRPRQAVKFWVKVKPSDYYNFGFADREKYLAVDLSYPGRGEFQLVGYIERSKPWAASLIQSLENGVAPSLVVELAYPAGEIKDNSQVEIVSILADTWWP